MIKYMFVLTQQRIDVYGQLGAFVFGNSAAGEVGRAAHADIVAHEHHDMLEPRSSGVVCCGFIVSSTATRSILALFHRNLYATCYLELMFAIIARSRTGDAVEEELTDTGTLIAFMRCACTLR